MLVCVVEVAPHRSDEVRQVRGADEVREAVVVEACLESLHASNGVVLVIQKDQRKM